MKISRVVKGFAFCLALSLAVQVMPSAAVRIFASEAAVRPAKTEVSAVSDSEVASSGTAEDTAEPVVQFELTEERTAAGKVFRVSDGSRLAVAYATPVHYEQDGQWLEIDNTLQFEAAGSNGDFAGYVNGGNSFQARFAAVSDASGRLFRVSEGGYSVQWSLPGASVTELQLEGEQHRPAVFAALEPLQQQGVKLSQVNASRLVTHPERLTDQVCYSGLKPGVDLRYTLLPNGVKEEIVLSAPQASYVFTFRLEAAGLTARSLSDGSILFCDSKDEEVFFIPAPYMTDAGGNVSRAVEYRLSPLSGGQWDLTVEADSSWMETAIFPVVIDPSIVTSNVRQYATGEGINPFYANVGKGPSSYYELYTVFPTLPALPASARVISATVQYPQDPAGGDSFRIYAYEVLSSWQLYNFSPPSVSSSPVAYVNTAGNNGGLLSMDVTALIQKWYTQQNFGIKLRASDLNRTDSVLLAAPSLLLPFRDTAGLEPYYTYSSMETGDVGLYVSHASGALTGVYSDFISEQPVFPVSFSHVYGMDRWASELLAVDYPDLYAGRGWKLSFQQTVRWHVSWDRYIYTDADGTVHYFGGNTGNSVYYDEDGLGITLTLTSDSEGDKILLTWSDGSRKVFRIHSNEVAYLLREETETGQSVRYVYDSGGTRVVSVLGPNYSASSGTRVNFSYDSSGYLTSAACSYQGTVQLTLYYTYTNGRLTSVQKVYAPGVSDTTAFTYSVGDETVPENLATVTDETSGLRLSVVCDLRNRVLRMQEISVDGFAQTAGRQVGFSYPGEGMTVVRTAGGDDVWGNSDDRYLRYGLDNAGRTKTVTLTDGANNVYSSSNYSYYGEGSNVVSYTQADNSLTGVSTAGMNRFYAGQAGLPLGSASPNALENSSFEGSLSGWEPVGTGVSRSTEQALFGSSSLKITDGKAYQYYWIDYNGDDAFNTTTVCVSGWAKASQAYGPDTPAKFCLRITMDSYGENESSSFVTFTNTLEVPFVWTCSEWQYVSATLCWDTGSGDYKFDDSISIRVDCIYEGNAAVAYFDGITVTPSTGETAEYNAAGHMSYSTSTFGGDSFLTYDSYGNVTVQSDRRGTASYTYGDSSAPHRLTKSVTPSGLQTEYQYEGVWGAVSRETVCEAGMSSSEYFSFQYDNGGFLIYSDHCGSDSTTYIYSGTLLTACRLAGVSETEYFYDARHRLTEVRTGTVGQASKPSRVWYTYDTSGRLATVNTPQSSFSFLYDGFGNTAEVKAGSTVLASYTYRPNNGRLLSMTYGNGDSRQYGYDSLGNVNAVTYNGAAAPRYTWAWDGNGKPVTVTDHERGRVKNYSYDGWGRLTGYHQKTTAGATLWSANITYDGYSRVSSRSWNLGRALNYTYTYNAQDWLTCMTLPIANSSVEYSYNYDGTVNGVSYIINDGFPIQKNYSYCTDANGQKRISTEDGGLSWDIHSYQYDSCGNLCFYDYTLYEYDALNQLTAVTNEYGDPYQTYTYDASGNILTRTEYDWSGTPTETKTWQYRDSPLGKQFVGFSDSYSNQWSYDAIGNLLMSCDENGIVTSYEWDGRQMTAMRGDSGDRQSTFSYDENGLRTRRTWQENSNSSIYIHDYIYDSGLLLKETVTEMDEYGNVLSVPAVMYYYYDAAGSPLGLNFNGTDYLYDITLIGGIVGIYTPDGTQVVYYSYDEWGYPTGRTESDLARYNSLRYRGYVYDEETGLYYLQSRYYNPETCRFVNADGQMAGVGGDVVGVNLYAYCGNNPINRFDPAGDAWWHWAIGAAVVVACAVAVVATAGGAAAGIAAVAMVANGVTAATTATTIAAATFIGSATAFGMAALTAASTSTSAEDFCEQGSWVTVSEVVGSGVLAGGLSYLSTLSKPSNPGKAFKEGKIGIQYGIDPNTLTPQKDLNSLAPQRMADAVKFAGDQSIIVSRTGIIQNGHHRVADAIINGRAVDIFVEPFK